MVGYCVGRDGNGFQLIATRGNGTGMDLSQRDGTGLVMIFIPVSLSTGDSMLPSRCQDRSGTP